MEGKIFCLMATGKPLTPAAHEALLINAVDMWYESRTLRRIKSRGYDGVIETNLEVIDYLGVPAVVFEANIATDKWGATDVRFVVRVDDLEGVEQSQWGYVGGSAEISELFDFLREGKQSDD